MSIQRPSVKERVALELDAFFGQVLGKKALLDEQVESLWREAEENDRTAADVEEVMEGRT